MKKRFILKVFVYFLSLSFLLLMNEFPRIFAEAKQKAIPVAQMVSRGEVKFEVKENSWEKVETPFPIFEEMKIKTEKGGAVLALADRTRIEVDSDSLFCFDQRDQFNLLQGKINFKIQPDVSLRFKMGNLWISKSYVLQTSKSPSVVLTKEKESAGSILTHPKGSVTVRSIQGPLYVTNEEGAVLASLSSGESITFPSVIASPKSPTRLAQVKPESTEEPTEEKRFLGLSPWEWLAIGGYVATGTGLILAFGVGEEAEEVPICP